MQNEFNGNAVAIYKSYLRSSIEFIVKTKLKCRRASLNVFDTIYVKNPESKITAECFYHKCKDLDFMCCLK